MPKITLSDCARVDGISCRYGSTNTQIQYQTHKGVIKFVELNAERSARFHEFVIKLAEEQRYETEEVNEDKLNPPSAMLNRLEAPKEKVVDADFTDEEISF